MTNPNVLVATLLEKEKLLTALTSSAEAVGLKLSPKIVPRTDLDDEHIAVDENTIVDIYPAGVEVRTLSGSIHVPGYVVTTTNVIPASRWVPEDADITDEVVTRSISEAVHVALGCVLNRRLEEFIREMSSEAGTSEEEG